MSGKPYGHEATIIRRPYGKPDNETIRIRRKGGLKVIERAARLASGFIELVSVEAFDTREQWERAFGVGTEHGPFGRRF